MQTRERRLEHALLVAASHCQGGHSNAGELIAELLDIPFPLTMENMRGAAEARGYDPDVLWPWWKVQRDERAGCQLYTEHCERSGMNAMLAWSSLTPAQRASWGAKAETARKLYTEYCDNAGIHSNRFPGWDELSDEQRTRWFKKAGF